MSPITSSPLRRRLSAIGAIALTGAALTPSSAFAFGTVNNLLDQRSEHERITRLALQCGAGQQAPACFQPVSLDNVAGKGGTWGGVGAADNLMMHKLSDEDFWHCDNADYLQPASNGGKRYKRSRTQALNALRDCIRWGRAMLYDGVVGTPGATFDAARLPAGTPLWGALRESRNLVGRDGKVAAADVGSCTFNGVSLLGNPKCNVLEPWGYVLHMAEDFYSHTNWADRADPARPLSVDNPPGLGIGAVAPFLDLRRGTPPADAEIPADFTGGCYTLVNVPLVGACVGRVKHGDSSSGLNKDKELIDPLSGSVSDPITPRAKITVDGTTNARRAVDGAVAEARRQWAVLRGELIQRYGVADGSKMACVLTMDRASVCNARSVVAAIDTSPGDDAAQAAGRGLLRRLTADDRVSVLTFDSTTGDQDPDDFTAPRGARIDDARTGDRPGDPSTTVTPGVERADDPSVVAQPDPAGTTSTPADQVPPGGDHESPGDTAGQPRPASVPAAAASRAAPAAPVAVAAAAEGPGQAPADAVASATALLANDDAPSGQRGVVIVTNRIGDAAALVARIDEAAQTGAMVSMIRIGEAIPGPVLAAVERSGGTAVAVPRSGDVAPGTAAATIVDGGLTRLGDALGADQEATLSDGAAPLLGITDRGVDAHAVAPLDDDVRLVVRALEQPVKVVVTDAATGTARRDTARSGDRASLPLRADGTYTVRIAGPDGRRYTAAVD